jgi:hypothetical protein
VALIVAPWRRRSKDLPPFLLVWAVYLLTSV